jgi:tRNA(Ser,Leu) C12 N-acetylase TAN1
LAKLNECKDRDSARETLSAIKNRDALASLARTLKVHVVKRDRREDIESKIVEFVIGGKLRTEAIRSLNLKGGSER